MTSTMVNGNGVCGHYSGCGCEVSDCCLVCPLPICAKYELPQGLLTYKNQLRNSRIALLYDEGNSVERISLVMGITKRNVYKALEKVSSGH